MNADNPFLSAISVFICVHLWLKFFFSLFFLLSYTLFILNDSAPHVTVIIPFYNQGQFLQECVESVLAQTYSQWEAIIVDDASNDLDVAAYLDGLGDSRLRTVRHAQNKGLAAARNTGFRQAATELVLPLDSDDRLAPEYLEKTVAYLDGHPEIDCVYADFQLFGDSSDIWYNSVKRPQDILVRQFIPGPGVLTRKSVWEKAGGYNETLRINEDWHFWIGAVQAGINPAHLPEPLYLYRRHGQSITATTAKPGEYDSRVFIYRYYQPFFDRYKAGKRFMMKGLKISLKENLRRGDYWRSYNLAIHAMLLEKGQWRLLPQVAKAQLRSVFRR
jgi:glycosyltransferase involved in cell wall biosynthesis